MNLGGMQTLIHNTELQHIESQIHRMSAINVQALSRREQNLDSFN